MSETKVIGIDLGATNIRAGLLHESSIHNIQSKRIKSEGTVDEVLADFYLLIFLEFVIFWNKPQLLLQVY